MPESRTTSRAVTLAQRPVGLPTVDTWEIVDRPIPEPGDGEMVVAIDYISLEPAMRGWLDDVPSYLPPVGIGDVMRSFSAGRVIASRHQDYAVGDLVTGPFGACEHALSDGTGVGRIDESIAAPPTWLGALGLTGMTAYFGLVDVGRVKNGDVVVVSGAAGAVGSVVGQLAKQRGCTVIGIAGGSQKCDWITSELGFDAAIDYRSEDVLTRLRELTPDGIDVYFDNVGGEVLDHALTRLNIGARVVICGAISVYNATDPTPGPSNYLALLIRRASMAGFIVTDFADQYDEGVDAIAELLQTGRLVAREEVVDGAIESFGETLLMLFDGSNTGKLVLHLTA